MTLHVFGMTVRTIEDAHAAAKSSHHMVTLHDDCTHMVFLVTEEGRVIVRPEPDRVVTS